MLRLLPLLPLLPLLSVLNLREGTHCLLCFLEFFAFAARPLQIVPAVLLFYVKQRGEEEQSQMALGNTQKAAVIGKYRTHASDCGSPEVQIALLSERIGQLTEHFKLHQKDHASRRGLLMMVNRRRRLLDYLKDRHTNRYQQIIQSLGIRR